jgi:hypothetical protein
LPIRRKRLPIGIRPCANVARPCAVKGKSTRRSTSWTAGLARLALWQKSPFAAGNAHTCALLSDSSVKCWGDNHFGQLGYGNTQNIGDDELPSSVGPVSAF